MLKRAAVGRRTPGAPMKIARKDVLFAIITNVVLLLGIPMTGAGQDSRPL